MASSHFAGLSPFIVSPPQSRHLPVPSSSSLIRLHPVAKSAPVVCSATAGNAAYAEKEREREILESYGLDPSEFDDSSTRQGRRRRRESESGRKGKRGPPPPPPEPPQPPRTTHKLLQVLSGTARRKKLLSPKGMDVRPMMEVVKGAAFAMIQVLVISCTSTVLSLSLSVCVYARMLWTSFAAGGRPASLRPGRWLDLYSGTGSVGIEAISRGCLEAHFVEMDPWVVSKVLRPNLEWTGFLDMSVIHMTRVENFLQQSEKSLGTAKPFDYISVTPPYTAVDYCILMNQIESSSLIGEDTFVLVEYPLKTLLADSCGCLVKMADRRFGRTNLAVYGPTWAQRKRKSGTPLLKEE